MQSRFRSINLYFPAEKVRNLKSIQQNLELEHVASVVEDTVLDYDFDKLKETFDNQMVGRFITAM